MWKTWTIIFDKTSLNIIWRTWKRYKKAPAVQEKETSTQTLVSGTQTEILHAKSESQINIDERLDPIITSDEYIVSNVMKMSDSSSTDPDSD